MSNIKDICPVCKFDEDHDEEGNKWICCHKCKQWMHIACIKLNPVPPVHVKWFCKKCLKFKAATSEITDLPNTTKKVIDDPTIQKNDHDGDLISQKKTPSDPAQNNVVKFTVGQNNGEGTVTHDVCNEDEDQDELNVLNEFIKQQAKLCE